MIVGKSRDEGKGQGSGKEPKEDRKGIVVGKKTAPRIPPPKVRPAASTPPKPPEPPAN